MPEPATSVSRQPNAPQAHRAPFRSTATCPISPASPWAPRWSRPARMTPADTPAMKADRSRTHVVLDDAWSTEPRLHLGAERKARPAEVDGETDAARQRI